MIIVMIKFATGHVGRMQVANKISQQLTGPIGNRQLSEISLEPTNEDILEAIRKATISWQQSETESKLLPVIGWEIADQTTFPTDPTFRNAWRHDGDKTITIDMPTARALVTKQLGARTTPEIASAQTPEELKSALDVALSN